MCACGKVKKTPKAFDVFTVDVDNFAIRSRPYVEILARVRDLKLERITDVTAFAVSEIVRTEGARPVVTCSAARPMLRSKMHRRQRRSHLPAACGPGLDRVTARAVHSGTRVTRVAEIHLKRTCGFRRSGKSSCLMADIARRHRVRGRGCVTLEARRVSTLTGRDRESHALTCRFVAGRAIDARVPRVVKAHGEIRDRRKAFHCSRFGIRMTDRADRCAAAGRKLLLVTADAGRVPCLAGEADPRRVIVTAMAKQARHSDVRSPIVREPRKIQFLRFGVEL